MIPDYRSRITDNVAEVWFMDSRAMFESKFKVITSTISLKFTLAFDWNTSTGLGVSTTSHSTHDRDEWNKVLFL